MTARMGDAAQGLSQIEWARRSMPLSAAVAGELPAGEARRVGIALPLDPATASMALLLVDAGFAVSLLADSAGPNTADLLAGLNAAGVTTCDGIEAFRNAGNAIVLDTKGENLSDGLKGATILASTTVKLPPVPTIHIGASPLIELCAVTHGVGQACVLGFLDITNLQIAGSHVLVIGYEAAGQGVAKFARSYGARVIVSDNDPVRAVQAKLDGHEVVALDAALPRSSVVFNTSENGPSLSLEQARMLPNGAFLCSATDNPDAFPLAELEQGVPGTIIRDHVSQYALTTGTNVKLVCNGRALHIQAGQGIPFEYADLQVAAQLYAIGELTSQERRLTPDLHPLTEEIERKLASAFL